MTINKRIFQYLFVYGTLRKKVPHNRNYLLRKHSHFVCMGKFKGRLYDTGPYPACVPVDSDSGWVVGEIYKITKSKTLLELIDFYEVFNPSSTRPQEFERYRLPILTNNATLISAWIYLYQKPVKEFKRIDSGDYRLYMDEKRKLRTLGQL